MITQNPFENMLDWLKALVISSIDDHVESRDQITASGSEYETLFCDSSNRFHNDRSIEISELPNSSLDEKIHQMYNQLKKTKWAPVCGYNLFDLGRKSNVEAVFYRNLGDDALRKGYEGYHIEAQAAYSSSLSFAVVGSVEEAVTYAKRSELWYHLDKYESSLLDLNRALNNDNCPASVKTELKARRLECIQKIKAINCRKIDLASEVLPEGSFAKIFPVYSGFFIPAVPEENQTDPRHIDLEISTHHQAMDISYKSQWGRYVVAKKDIEPGEVISKEEHFAMALRPERALNNCGYCFVRCDALIPCQNCVYELYCSGECREMAFYSYHKFECKIWPYYLEEQAVANECAFILSVRTFLTGTKQGTDLKNLMQDPNFQDLFPSETSYRADMMKGGYATICNEEAITNFVTNSDILQSIKLIHVLRKLYFFSDADLDTSNEGDYPDNLTEIELFAVKLLLKNLVSRKSNSFVIVERVSSAPLALEQKCNTLGEGTPGLHSFINHSCDPNAAELTRRRNSFVYALRPIKTGEQIFISYGYCFFDGSLSNRIQQSSLFGFRCSCVACVDKWPQLADLKTLGTQYLTENSDVISKIEDTLRFFWNTSDSQARNPIVKPWKIMCDHCKDLHAYLAKPSFMIVKCENFMEECMRYLSNCYIDPYA